AEMRWWERRSRTPFSRLAHGCGLVQRPAETRAGVVREVAQVGEAGSELLLGDAGQLGKRGGGALDDVGGVVGLSLEVVTLPPVRPLAFVDVAKARLAEPARE